MFKIPVANLKNANELSSVIESILEGLTSNAECGFPLADLFSELQKNEKLKDSTAPALASAFGSKNMINGFMDKFGKPPQQCDEYTYEMSESADHIIIYVDIPGVTKDQIVISYNTDNILHVECDRKPDNACLVVLKSTIKYGTKALHLHVKNASSNACNTDIKASYANGVLSVSIPKEVKPQRCSQFIRVD